MAVASTDGTATDDSLTVTASPSAPAEATEPAEPATQPTPVSLVKRPAPVSLVKRPPELPTGVRRFARVRQFLRRRALSETKVPPVWVTADAVPRGPLNAVAAAALAAASGTLLVAAFPPYGLWWLAPFAVAALAVATSRQKTWYGLVLGGLHGAAFFAPLLHWTGLYVGPIWLLLPAVQTLFLCLLGGAAAVASRWGPWSLAVVTPLLWVGQEALRSRVPWGGFPWGRVAFSQDDSPMLRLASLGGAPLVTFAVALVGGLLAAAVVWPRGYPAGRLARRMGALVAAAGLVAALGFAVPLPAANGKVVTVAVIQGNVPRLGLDFNAQRRAVLDNHVGATTALARQVADGTAAQPDLVVWPENSSDIDPLENPDANALVQDAADRIGVPVLVGAVLEGPGRFVSNAGIVWHPRTGPGERYIKQHPVPFAEYMPLRSIARKITKKVDLVRRDFTSGDSPGVLRLGPATIGDVICFEVAYDDLVRATVDGGADLLVVQTNNATFGRSAESDQQLAMVRLRAIEHGRPAVMASTSGVSATMDSGGRILDRSGLFEAAILVRDLRLSGGRTLATMLGGWPETLLAFLGLVAVVTAAFRHRRRRPAPQLASPSATTPLSAQGGRVTTSSDSGSAAPAYPGLGRVLVVVPTYNECENVRLISARLRAAVPEAHLLVADDNSPDGTGEIADELAAADDHIKVLHRAGKQGLGAAYIAGFNWALERGYDVVVEMDADGSHAPEELPRLLNALRENDLVLGSRWVPGGKVVNWPKYREYLSKGGSLYSRLALGVPVRDVTGGFRAYRSEVLQKIELETIVSQGYCFQIDLAVRSWKAGFRVAEVPITFAERELGQSKMSSNIVREALWRVTVWGVQSRTAAVKRAFTRKA